MDGSPDARDVTSVALAAPDHAGERDREALAKVASLLRGLRYGTILLVVHDGEVVQIEAAEKIRLR